MRDGPPGCSFPSGFCGAAMQLNKSFGIFAFQLFAQEFSKQSMITKRLTSLPRLRQKEIAAIQIFEDCLRVIPPCERVAQRWNDLWQDGYIHQESADFRLLPFEHFVGEEIENITVSQR